MQLEYNLSEGIDIIDWTELAGIFERAPLGHRDPAKLKAAFTNSQYRCFAHSNGLLIGAGRAISDRATHAVIFDVVLLPEFQGQGIGAAMMRKLIDQALSEVPKILLYAVPGKEGFYEKLGFRPMKNGDGALLLPRLAPRKRLHCIVARRHFQIWKMSILARDRA